MSAIQYAVNCLREGDAGSAYEEICDRADDELVAKDARIASLEAQRDALLAELTDLADLMEAKGMLNTAEYTRRFIREMNERRGAASP